MIKQFLESKYGEFVTKQFLTISNEVIWDNFNKDGTDQQIEVATHLKNLKDANNNQ